MEVRWYKLKKNQENQKNKTEDEDKPDFSFKVEDVHGDIDRAIEKRKGKMSKDEFKIEHLSDKVRFAKAIKEEPPLKDFMKVEAKEAIVETEEEVDGEIVKKEEKGVAIISYHDKEPSDKDSNVKVKKVAIYNGLFSIDLNIDAYFWFVRACNIFPLILDQGIRTHLDIKRSHEPEKRKHELPIYLIGAVILGMVMLVLIFNFIFKGG